MIVFLIGVGAPERVEDGAQGTGKRVEDGWRGIPRAEVPAGVRIPEAAMLRRMWVIGRIGVGVVKAVVACPLDGSARRKAESDEAVLQPRRDAQRAMRQNAVVAKIHAQACEQIVDGRE